MRALLVIDMQNDFVLPGSPVTVAGALLTLLRRNTGSESCATPPRA